MIFFENVACVNCGREIGFLPESLSLNSLDPAADGLWQPTLESKGALRKKCRNYSENGICNWMLPQDAADEVFCVSCRLNEVIPDLSKDENRILWAQVESAKRRLIYSLLRLGLPVAGKQADPEHGVAFRFLSDVVNADGTTSKVMTFDDHTTTGSGADDIAFGSDASDAIAGDATADVLFGDNGIITLNIAEADDAHREATRHAMSEPYRTLLGHFRHEIGHFYWDRLVRDSRFLKPFRELFGDEQADYDHALENYYKGPAPANWQESHISAYATSHPWEDWAETWAHFLHIQDALEVANDFGLTGKRILLSETLKDGKRSWLSSKQATFDEVIGSWSELVVALNSMNRSMGLPDLYPFVLSAPVITKLKFIHEVIMANSAATRSNAVASKA